MGFRVNWYSGDRGAGAGVGGGGVGAGMVFPGSGGEGGLNELGLKAGRDGADGAFVGGEGRRAFGVFGGLKTTKAPPRRMIKRRTRIPKKFVC